MKSRDRFKICYYRLHLIHFCAIYKNIFFQRLVYRESSFEIFTQKWYIILLKLQSIKRIMNRKNFIKQSALMTGAGLVLPGYTSLQKGSTILGANDTINIGAIGINGMGWADTKALLKIPGVKLTAICDVDQNVLDKRKAEMKEQGVKVKTFSDYRKLLEQKDVDAVVIGSPDHWHALMMIHASEAGKHVYSESP